MKRKAGGSCRRIESECLCHIPLQRRGFDALPVPLLLLLAVVLLTGPLLTETATVRGFSPTALTLTTRLAPQWARLLQQNGDGDDDNANANDGVTVTALGDDSGADSKRRRSCLLVLSTTAALTTSALSLSLCLPLASSAAANPRPSTATPTGAPSQLSLISPEQAVVTDKVFFDVRISRQDGTFYVRDDLPDTPENTVFSGRLIVGLFGRNAPNHVQRFLQYVNAGFNPLDDDDSGPLPSYSRSTFPRFDQATGVLYGGSIASLEVTELQGSAALRYGERLFPARLWVDEPPRISHAAAGLLTHRQFDVTPVFGITTRTDTTELDRTHTVFGKLVADAASEAFLGRVAELPTYSVDRRPAGAAAVSSELLLGSSAVDGAAEAVFNAQRDFFRGAAKSLGDTRVGKLYEGKLLRRVEVTQVGVL